MPGVNVRIIILGGFCRFSAKKIGVFLKKKKEIRKGTLSPLCAA
jgi:hypothetical protein